jgi:hypothetical protein
MDKIQELHRIRNSYFLSPAEVGLIYSSSRETIEGYKVLNLKTN